MPYTLDQLEAFVSSPHYDSVTAGLIAAGIPALKAAGAPGELIEPGVRRIRGNLCNVHGRYGPCDKAGGGAGAKKKPAKGRAPAKPKQTPEQQAQERAERQAARQQETTAEQARNLTKVADDTGLSDDLANLDQFGQGKPIRPQDEETLIKQGLMERGTDGAARVSAQGRVLINAAKRGDTQRARDAMSRGRDQVAAGADRAKRQQDAAGKRASAQIGRELTKRQPKPAKASAGGSKKPAAHAEPAPERPRAQPKPKRASRSSAPTIGGSSGGSSAKPKPAAPKPEKAPAKQIAPALQTAADQLSQGAELSDDDTQALIRNGLAKLNKDGELILTAAGMRATTKSKEVTHGLEAGTLRTPAQRAGIGGAVRKTIRTRHDWAQPADAHREAGRTARQGTSGQSIKATPAHTGVMVAFYPDPAAAKQIVAQDGVTEPIDRLHLTLAFLGDSTETALATSKDKVIAAVKQWAVEQGKPLEGTINGLGRFFHSEDDDTNAVFVSPDVPGLPELRQSLVEWIEQSGFDYAQNHGFTPHITVAYVPLDAPTPPIRVETPITFDHVTLAWGDEQFDYPLGVTTKDFSFCVFKDANGHPRWVAQSSTAFQDRDREIVSTKALADDVAFADESGSYGPLRWWHTPGLDLGDCDFNAMHGRVLIESGTFRSPVIAQKVAAAAAGLEISLGFLHLPNEPDADGVFHHIRRFERSLVPRGKASNRFTAFSVKELPRMDATKKDYLRTKLKFSDAEIAEIEARATATEKAADDALTAFKADEPAELPDLVINGITYKAFPPKKDDEPLIEAVVEEDAFVEEAIEEEEIADENALTLSSGDLAAISEAIQAAVATIMGGLDLEKKVASHVQGFLQPMQQAQTTKDAQAAQTAEQLTKLTQQVAELTGDQPAVPYRASQASDNIISDAKLLEAVKNANPTAGPFDDIIQGLGLFRPQ